MENKAMDDNDGENFTKVGVKRSCPENDETITSSKKKDLNSINQGLVVSKEEKSSMEHESFVSSSAWKKLDEQDQLEFARAKMGEVKEENQKLKMYLSRIMKDYQNLQTKFKEIVHDQEPGNKSTDSNNNLHDVDMESDDLVSLSLGRTDSKKDETDKTSIQEKKEDEKDNNKNDDDEEEGLTLGLDYKFEVSKSDGNETLPNPSSENSSEQERKEEVAWSPSKGGKTIRSGEDDEVLEQNPAKKTRVSVRARCDTPTLNDGCQWRKYGQKIAKGNPCPRAYYRCTVAPSCPVRKQVQRCAEDISILITTYEGTHNHPLSASATAMASTTAAAASMLLSGSTSTTNPSLLAQSTTTTIPANLNGLNFYLSDNNSKSKQFYLPTNSSFSSSTSHPTITLDLTTSTLPSAAATASSSSPFHRMFSSGSGLTYPQGPRYPSTSLNFSASPSDQYSNTLSWGGVNGNFLNYGNVTNQASYSNKNTYGSIPNSSLNLGRQNSLETNPNIFQSFIPTNIPSRQTLPADTIAAATKAITADPSFQSALAAALTSILGSGSSNNTGTAAAGGGAGGSGGGGGAADNLGRKLNWLTNDQHRHQSFPIGATGGYISSSTMSAKGNNNACGSSYLNNSSSTGNNHQQKSLMLLPAPKTSSFSNSKSASASPTDTRDHHSS